MSNQEKQIADRNCEQLLKDAHSLGEIMRAFILAYKLDQHVPNSITRATLIAGLKSGLKVARI